MMTKFRLFLHRFLLLYLCFWISFFHPSLQFPPGLEKKRFNIEAVPAGNGKIMLHLKSRYGSRGLDGPMGDQGPTGPPGSPGLTGEQGDPGLCSVEQCAAMKEASALVSRITALENLVKQRGLHSDVEDATKPSDSPLMALHITSDILLTKGNSSNGKSGGLPGNINVNIALKNAAPFVSTDQSTGKFLVNSTVQLLDRSKVNKAKSGIARVSKYDGVYMTERQFQSPQQQVPSIKRNRIPVMKNRNNVFGTG